MKIDIVIPAYNAEKTLESVIKRIPKNFKYREIIVVNDASTDRTREVAEKLDLTVLNHERNRGYGGAQKTGFRYSINNNSDVIVLLHADGQYPPERIENMVKPILNGRADAVTGTRFGRYNPLEGGMPIIRFIGNRFLSLLTRILTGLKVSETHNGYRVYRTKALKDVNFEDNSEKFEFDTEILLRFKSKGYKIVEVENPTIYAEEVSYLNPITYGFRVLNVLLKYLILRKYRD